LHARICAGLIDLDTFRIHVIAFFLACRNDDANDDELDEFSEYISPAGELD
jgi:hypothetical protein